jgi:hypothetical protein
MSGRVALRRDRLAGDVHAIDGVVVNAQGSGTASEAAIEGFYAGRRSAAIEANIRAVAIEVANDGDCRTFEVHEEPRHSGASYQGSMSKARVKVHRQGSLWYPVDECP